MWPPSIPGLVFGVPLAIAVTAVWAARWPSPKGLAGRGTRWLVLAATAALIAFFWAFGLLLGLGAVLMGGLSKLGGPPRATRPAAPPYPARRTTSAQRGPGGGHPGLWNPPSDHSSQAAQPTSDVPTVDLRGHEQQLSDWRAFQRGNRGAP